MFSKAMFFDEKIGFSACISLSIVARVFFISSMHSDTSGDFSLSRAFDNKGLSMMGFRKAIDVFCLFGVNLVYIFLFEAHFEKGWLKKE